MQKIILKNLVGNIKYLHDGIDLPSAAKTWTWVLAYFPLASHVASVLKFSSTACQEFVGLIIYCHVCRSCHTLLPCSLHFTHLFGPCSSHRLVPIKPIRAWAESSSTLPDRLASLPSLPAFIHPVHTYILEVLSAAKLNGGSTASWWEMISMLMCSISCFSNTVSKILSLFALCYHIWMLQSSKMSDQFIKGWLPAAPWFNLSF